MQCGPPPNHVLPHGTGSPRPGEGTTITGSRAAGNRPNGRLTARAAVAIQRSIPAGVARISPSRTATRTVVPGTGTSRTSNRPNATLPWKSHVAESSLERGARPRGHRGRGVHGASIRTPEGSRIDRVARSASVAAPGRSSQSPLRVSRSRPTRREPCPTSAIARTSTA